MQTPSAAPGALVIDLMDQCARILLHPDPQEAARQASQLDLRPIAHAFRNGTMATLFLARSVEELSGEQQTVRRANARLFAEPPFGTARKFDLGLCPYSRRLLPIDTMTPHITLFRIGGVVPGMTFEQAAAS